MDVRHLGTVALLAVMAVAALFFFPAAHGSYSATHGPITALRSFRLRAFLMFVITAAATVLTALVYFIIALGFCRPELSTVSLHSRNISSSPLRC